MAIIIFIALLVALILVHELGHFAVAKFFKIRVDEFGIFFPPRVAAVKKGETEYSFNALPFGGFVKIFGEHAEDADNPRSFAGKPRLVQAAVIAAGVAMNILFAWIILSLGYMAGLPTPRESNIVGNVENVQTMVVAVLPGSPAERSGVLPEDTVQSVGTAGETLPLPLTAEDAQEFMRAHQEESIVLTVLRKEEEKTFVLRAQEGVVEGRKAIGIEMGDIGTLKLPSHTALVQGAYLTYRMTIATAEGLLQFFGKIFSARADFTEVAGPIGIVGIGAGAVEEGYVEALLLTAVISVNLAILNLLPIPGLDGGRLFIIGIESITRRRVPERIVFGLTIGGFIFLIGLMLVISYYDITRLVQ